MDQVAIIREKIDIVSLISEFITLKKAGRNFKANCPFHNEKSPSFVVSPERQIWHCFGCQKGGDALSFLMEYEHIEFPEALRILGKKVGVEIKEVFGSPTFSQKEKIFQINKQAAKFYNYILTKHIIGKKALNYLIQKTDYLCDKQSYLLYLYILVQKKKIHCLLEFFLKNQLRFHVDSLMETLFFL